MLSDATVLAAGMLAAAVLCQLSEQRVTGRHLTVAALSLPLWVGLFAHHRLYQARFIVRRVEEWRRLLRAAATAVVLTTAFAFAVHLTISRLWLLLSIVFAVPGLLLEREIARRMFRRMRESGRLMRSVVVVGGNDEARELIGMLKEDPSLGYQVVGFVADDLGNDEQWLGTVADTIAVVRETEANGVIIAASAVSLPQSNRLVRELIDSGIHVELSSTLRDVAPERLTVRPLGRYPMVYLEPCHVDGWRRAAKRTFDIVVACLGLIVVAPTTLFIALAVRLDSEGPAFFRQKRVGKDGVCFSLLKFRTMVVDAEARFDEVIDLNEVDGPLFKLRNDPRTTRVGRFLRRTSLDELPQLFNVLRGQMSIVGPRPALPIEALAWDDPQLSLRLRVKPGMTGMWQVSGRSAASFESYARLDLYYVDNWSLLNDLTIVMKTVPAVLRRRGAY